MLLSACSSRDQSHHAVDIGNAASEARTAIDNHSAATPVPIPAQTTVAPKLATPHIDPASLSEPEGMPDSAQAAAKLVETYYGLLGEGRYREAWAMWDDDGAASGMNAQSFAASFANYATYRATIGAPGAIEAGAGQRYITLPVEVTGTLKADGTRFTLAGQMILHRVGDVDGATAAQRSWRINASELRPRP